MSNNASGKKKTSLLKILLWVLGIFLIVQFASNGEFLGDEFGSNKTGAQSSYSEPTEIIYKNYFGISGQDTENNDGALVISVVADSPAEKAGVQVGDIITAMGNRTICNGEDVMAALNMLPTGTPIEVSIRRDGTVVTLYVTLEEKTDVTTGTGNSATPGSSDDNDRYPSLPVDLRNHVLLGSRDQGVSATLTGDVLITVIFVNDPTSLWTEGKMAATKASDAIMTAEILSEAASYGAKLNITMEYRQASVNITEESDVHSWAEQIVADAGLGSLATASSELERTKGVKEAPIMFYLNTTERSYAMPYSDGTSEYAIIWNCGSDNVAYRHELFHLFGASDFYMPKEIAESAGRYFPNSTMLGSETPMTDDLTAYLIGWTDTLTEKALSFLYDTDHITSEDVSNSYEKETYTGYVENWEKDGHIITGYLDMGVLEGQGKVIDPNGGWREGYFEYGVLVQGRCKIIYEDGGWYEGGMDQGLLHGQGTIAWSNGDRYTGDFYYGNIHGYGTYVWADGTSATGMWENGALVS